jgi:cephalosporin-C deacetylase-like acetyl esterase
MLNKYVNDDSDVETIDFQTERISSISVTNNSNCLSKMKKKLVKPTNKDNHIEDKLLFYDYNNNYDTKKKSIFSYCIII